MSFSYQMEKTWNPRAGVTTHDHGALLLSCGALWKRTVSILVLVAIRRHVLQVTVVATVLADCRGWKTSGSFLQAAGELKSSCGRRAVLSSCRRVVLFKPRRSFLALPRPSRHGWRDVHSLRSPRSIPRCSPAWAELHTVHVFTIAAPNFF